MAEPNRKLPPLTQQDIERFWSKVDKAGPVPEHRPELGPCWVWTAGVFKVVGYGVFTADRGRRVLKAHRVSYFLATGIDPISSLACHHCDRPECVNPAHIFLGTWADNMHDRDAKGRTSRGQEHAAKVYRAAGDDNWTRKHPEKVLRGEQCGTAVLTDDKVRTMRRMHRNGWSSVRIAKELGVSQMTAWLVVNKRTWKHVVD